MNPLGGRPTPVYFVCLAPDIIDQETFRILVQADAHQKDTLPHGVLVGQAPFAPSTFEWLNGGALGRIALRLCNDQEEARDLLYEFDRGIDLECKRLSEFVRRMGARGLNAETRFFAEQYVFPYLQRYHSAALNGVHEALRLHYESL